MARKPGISVVLSFFNEEDVLEELVSRLRHVFRNDLKGRISGYELIFVNDASTDKSRSILLGLAKKNADIRIINMSRNFGVSPCALAGMENATGDAVIYMDADLQDPPELIPEMFRVWLESGAEVVNTKRMSRSGETKIKLLITKLGYTILNKISNIHIEPEVGDFKLLSRRAVNEVVRLKEKRPFLRALVTWIGFKQATINYNREARYAGETKFKVYGWRVISNFLDSALISFSDIPLKLALFIGFIVSFGAFSYLAIIFLMKYMGLALPGWAAIMATMLLLGGIQLFTLGMLGLYINAMFLEIKRRPNYIIESKDGYGIKKAQNKILH